jgi:alcohol dehydrogenase (cytochrome c)
MTAPDVSAMSLTAKSVPTFRPVSATLSLTDGRTLRGTLMGQSRSDTQLLTADGKIHLLARLGDRYRDKPIAPKSDWLTYHGSLSGNRYSNLDQVNTGNIQKLTKAWTFPIPTSPRLQATPIVVDGVMYMTGWNEVYAVDGTTGHQIWSYRRPHTQGILSEAGRGSNRGVAISGDRLFVVMDNAHLLALDRRNGAELWEADRGSVKDSISASSAPLVVGDLVVSGISGGEEGVRGFIDAYNVSTGKRVWRFYSIPKRGEKGSETWIGQAIEHGCGATWMTGSYDSAFDLIYWGTGNPCPDSNGTERLGDNLYTSSVVALSAKTGELKWYFQFTPHDTHDWDSTESMILIDRPWKGRERKLLVHGDRNGYFFVFDRGSGELLLAQPLSTKVTWSTGYGKDGRPVLTSTPGATPEGTALCPGDGSTNWIDPSYNPLTELFYVRVSDSCGIYASGDDPLTSGNRWYGDAEPGEKARAALAELTKNYPDRNYIRAFDIGTGRKVWEYLDAERSGVLSTAGGLVFIGGNGGIIALDAKTGKQVGSVNSNQPPTAQPVFAASPMTYMVGGKQYIALAGMGNVTAYAFPR